MPISPNALNVISIVIQMILMPFLQVLNELFLILFHYLFLDSYKSKKVI